MPSRRSSRSSRSRARSAVAALTVVLLAAGLAACGTDDFPTGGTDTTSSTTADPGSSTTTEPDGDDDDDSGDEDLLVTVDDAREAVEAFMEANNEANGSLDTSILVSIETGAAAAIDEAAYRGQRAQGNTSVSTFDWDDIEVFVPRSKEYPASFLSTVEISDTSNPSSSEIQVQVFEKASSTADWKVSHYNGMAAGSALPLLDVDDAGYLNELDPADLALTPDDLIRGLGTLMKDPAAESPVETSGLIDSTRDGITEHVAEEARATLKHDVTYDVPSAPSYATYLFPLADGGALAFGVLGVRETIQPINAGETVEVPTALTGGLVPTGTYAKLDMRSLVAFMGTVPAADDDSAASMISMYSGIISATAT